MALAPLARRRAVLVTVRSDLGVWDRWAWRWARARIVTAVRVVLFRLRDGGAVAHVAAGAAAGSRLGQGIAEVSSPCREAPLPVQSRMPVFAAAEEALGELACRAASLCSRPLKMRM